MGEQKKTCYACVNCDSCPLRQEFSKTLAGTTAWILRLPNKVVQARETIMNALTEVCPLFEAEDTPF